MANGVWPRFDALAAANEGGIVNKPLRRVAVACLLLFGLLLVNVNYRQAVKASDYRSDTRNSRTLLRTFTHERGPIVVSTGGVYFGGDKQV